MNGSDSGYQAFRTYEVKSNNNRSRLVIFIAVFFILLAIILTGLFVLGSMQKKQIAVVPTPTVEATTTPLPTSSVSAVLTVSLTGEVTPETSLSPTKPGAGLKPVLTGTSTSQPVSISGISTIDRATKLDRAKLSIEVLNGSGITGAAAEVSLYLKSLGYNISGIGNADVFSYKGLTVQVKKSKSGYAELLKKDLQAKPEYAGHQPEPGFANVTASVSDTINSDAEVIVGK